MTRPKVDVRMAKTWVLDSETKGTGAHVVPLETDEEERRPEARPEAVRVPKRAPRRPLPAPPPPAPRRFRVIDLMTREVLADDVDARATIDALRDVRSIVDADIYVSDGDDRGWRRLSLAAQKRLWALGHPTT
jgi:hypothetical protein